MKQLLFASLIFLTASLEAQTSAPSAYTTYYGFRQWASGANPSADSLNQNWADLDSVIHKPEWILPDSVVIGAASSPSAVRLYVANQSRLDTLTTVQHTTNYQAAQDSAQLGVYAAQSGVLRISDGAAGVGIARFLPPPDGWASNGQVIYWPASAGTIALQSEIPSLTSADSIKTRALNVTGKVTADTILGYVVADSIDAPNVARTIYSLSATDTTSAGDVVEPTIHEETHDETYHTKIICYFVKRAGDMYVRCRYYYLIGGSQVTNGKIKLNVGSENDEDTYQSGSGYAERSKAVSGVAANTVVKVTVQLWSGATDGTIDISQVVIDVVSR